MDIDAAHAIKERYSSSLLQIEGVQAVGVEQSEEGMHLAITLDRPADQLSTTLPSRIEGLPVQTRVSDPFTAQESPSL